MAGTRSIAALPLLGLLLLTAAAAAARNDSLASLLAKADAATGEATAQRQCGVCHSFTQGGKTGVGPNLYGVIGSPFGGRPGFSYSAALQAKPGVWTPEALNRWLARPDDYVPDTRMGFAGISDARRRADIIAFLCSLSPEPSPCR